MPLKTPYRESDDNGMIAICAVCRYCSLVTFTINSLAIIDESNVVAQENVPRKTTRRALGIEPVVTSPENKKRSQLRKVRQGSLLQGRMALVHVK